MDCGADVPAFLEICVECADVRTSESSVIQGHFATVQGATLLSAASLAGGMFRTLVPPAHTGTAADGGVVWLCLGGVATAVLAPTLIARAWWRAQRGAVLTWEQTLRSGLTGIIGAVMAAVALGVWMHVPAV